MIYRYHLNQRKGQGLIKMRLNQVRLSKTSRVSLKRSRKWRAVSRFCFFTTNAPALTACVGGMEIDQHWARPALKGFENRKTDKTIDFQQIDAEEAMIDGSSVVRLFGVTTVSDE